jgi:RNA 2',3'-cyclic 3'-phosphodiesterase
MRTFISIKLPTKVLMKIKEIQEALPAFTGKKTELKNLHLTLKFLGEVSSDKLEEIKSRLENIKLNKFEAEINGLGFFDNRSSNKFDRNIVLWLGIINCENIQKEVDKSLKGAYEIEKRFMAHITIARVKEVQEEKTFIENIKKISIPKMPFIVDKFYLIESILKKEGSEYCDIEKYNLI